MTFDRTNIRLAIIRAALVFLALAWWLIALVTALYCSVVGNVYQCSINGFSAYAQYFNYQNYFLVVVGTIPVVFLGLLYRNRVSLADALIGLVVIWSLLWAVTGMVYAFLDFLA